MGGEQDPETPRAKLGHPMTDAEDATRSYSTGTPERFQPSPLLPLGHRLGQYEVREVLGRGGMATVYLAHDSELDREVAIKVPRVERLGAGEAINQILTEARTVARLEHQAIVPVYHAGRSRDGVPYIVMKYVRGRSLQDRLGEGAVLPSHAAELMLAVAEAVDFAHRRGFVHRDLKPANIILDEFGQPYVTDFGLTRYISLQSRHCGMSGTCAYLSPEEVRGETHRLDQRSDIWSLGVMMYELLAGRRPFQGETMRQVLDEITRHDPPSPRQLQPATPPELARICLTCLAKRASDRYQTTADLIEDLRHWLEKESAAAAVVAAGEGADAEQALKRAQAKVVPKGLRSFDADDADFFLQLLPGPCDRDGLPKAIRFWKERIEEEEPEEGFPVGLIYGPSGCGKSSLVKAGLLPRLSEKVLPVYVEAAAADTEVRILKALRKRCPQGAAEGSLPEVFAHLRATGGPAGRKILVVLDQFEQWLHANTVRRDSQLLLALRQCDGVRLQCLVMVRDDFWMSITRFMQALELPLVEGDNSAAVDLFDCDHARKVLTLFGQVLGRLNDPPTGEQVPFLDHAIEGLAQDDMVVCVRLAVLAEMMKRRPWTRSSLRAVGGAQGLGAAFLEETFSARTAPPAHRIHEKAVRAVLKALLPEQGTGIKGCVRSFDDLLEASVYADRRADFDALLAILDGELRVITPVDPHAPSDGTSEPAEGGRHYQLTHDFLVPSVHEWLTCKQRETRQGRAELRLAERSALWNARPEKRYLPKAWEYLSIRCWTSQKDWTDSQRQLMHASGRFHALRAAVLSLVVALVGWGFYEIHGNYRAGGLLAALDVADENTVLDIVDELARYHRWARRGLYDRLAADESAPAARRRRFHAQIALASHDGTHVPQLLAALWEEHVAYAGVLRDLLGEYRENVCCEFWAVLHDASAPPDRRLRAGLLLAGCAPASQRWNPEDFALLAETLVAANPVEQPRLWDLLQPLAARLLPELKRIFHDQERSECQLAAAANALVVFAPDDGPLLAELLTTATADQFAILFSPVSERHSAEARRVFAEAVVEQSTDSLSEPERVDLGMRRAGAAIGLLRLGEVAASQGAFRIDDDPESLTQFVHRCRDRGVSADELVASLRLAGDVHSRFAQLLALGDYPLAEIDRAGRDLLIEELSAIYRSDRSSAIRGGAGWLLRQWGYEDLVREVDRTKRDYDPEYEWFVKEIHVTGPGMEFGPAADAKDASGLAEGDRPIYMTFAVFPPGEYLMGSPAEESTRHPEEQLRKVVLTRPVAVGVQGQRALWVRWGGAVRGFVGESFV